MDTDYQTRQFYSRTVKLMHDGLEPHARECAGSARAVAKGGPSPMPAEQSLQVLSILDGIYRSQKAARKRASHGSESVAARATG